LQNINLIYINNFNHFVFKNYINNKIQKYYNFNQTKTSGARRTRYWKRIFNRIKGTFSEMHNEAGRVILEGGELTNPQI